MTHFSSAANGSGVERETIFSDAVAAMLANNPFKATATQNPFADENGGTSTLTGTNTGTENGTATTTTTNPFSSDGGDGGKYNTIGRSNPFSSSSSSKNPFLSDQGNDTKPDEPKTTVKKVVSTRARKD